MFGGGFQQQQSQAGFGFGSKPVATPGFGVGANQSFGNSSFGTPDKGASGGLFGQSTSLGGVGAAPVGSFGGGMFGSNKTASTPPQQFGGAQQQNQPAGGGMFGGNGLTSAFGATNNTASLGGGGMFGGAQQQTQPAGGGMFGGNGATSAFGATNNTASLGGGGMFGGAQQQTQPAGGGMFGGNGATSAFGATNNSATTGTGNPPFQPVLIQETIKVQGRDTKVTNHIEVISAMPAYESKSFEELRLEDYQKNNKGPTSGGSGGMFGQSTSSTLGAFNGGSPAAPTGGFGFNASPSNPPAASGGFSFGSNSAPPPVTGGFSFGSNSASAPAPASGGFNFGSTSASTAAPANATGSFSFGSTSASAPAAGGFNFGSTTVPAAAPAPATGGFGFGSAPASSTNPTGGFGFGSTTTAAPPSGGLSFGSGSSAAAAPATGGFNFGSNSAAAPATAAGGFGLGSAAAPANATGGFSFGSTSASAPAAGGFNFGSTSVPAAAPAPATGVFGFGSAPAALPVQAPGATAVPVATQSPVVLVDLGAKVEFLRRKKDEMEVHFRDKSNSTADHEAIVLKAEDSNIVLRDSVSEGSDAILPFRNAPRATARILPRGYHRSINSNLSAQTTPSSSARTPQSGSKNSVTTTVRSSTGILSPDVLRSRNTLRLVIDQTPTSSAARHNDPTDILPVPSTGRSVGANSISAQSTSFASPSAELFNRVTDDVKKIVSSDLIAEFDVSNLSPVSMMQASGSHSVNKENKQALNLVSSPEISNAADISLGTPFFREADDGNFCYSNNVFAPKLTTSGYDTIPSRQVLNDMSEDELKKVTQFRVYRPGIGEICWPGVTDVRGLDLDKIVRIELKEVFVYDDLDEDEKPPQGTELNKYAIITLWNIFPKSSKSQFSVEKMNAFEDKLHRACESAGAKFQEYSPQTGEWIFTVDHFSRYGLQEDSDSDDDIPTNNTVGPVKKHHTDIFTPRKQFVVRNAIDIDHSYSLQSARKVEINEDCDAVHGVEVLDDQLSSSKEPPVSVMSHCNSPQPTVSEQRELDSLPSTRRWWSQSNDFCVGGTVLFNALDSFYSEGHCFHPRRNEIDSSFGSLDLLQSVRNSMKTSTAVGFKCNNVDEATSAVPRPPSGVAVDKYKCAHKSIDMALYMRNSCRVGFNRYGGFACGTRNRDSLGNVTGYKVSISQLKTCTGDSNGEVERTENSIMDAMLDACFCELKPHDTSVAPLWKVPVVNFDELTSSAYGKVVKFIRHTMKIQEDQNSGLNRSLSNEVLGLCVKLVHAVVGQEREEMANDNIIPVFEAGSCHVGVTGDENWERRCGMVSAWLESASRHDGRCDNTRKLGTDKDCYLALFDLLSCKQIDEAVELSQSSGLWHLSMLLTQLSGDEVCMDSLSKEVDSWLEHDVVVEDDLLALYKLMAGKLIYEVQTGDQLVSILSGVSWIRALSMFYWYSMGYHPTVAMALQCYENALDASAGLVHPPYSRATRALKVNSHSQTMQYSVLYHLLHVLFPSEQSHMDDASIDSLFSHTVNSLNPLGHTDELLDYRGSHLLLFLLVCCNLFSVKCVAACVVRQHVISQLLLEGDWKWALFVALQVENEMIRTHLARDIVNQWIPCDSTCCDDLAEYIEVSSANSDYLRDNAAAGHTTLSDGVWVIVMLKIPKEWVCEAIAMRFYNSAQSLEVNEKCDRNASIVNAVRYFVLGGNFMAASRIITEELAAQWMFSIDSNRIKKGAVASWENNGAPAKLHLLLGTIEEGIRLRCLENDDVSPEPASSNVGLTCEWYRSHTSGGILLEYFRVKKLNVDLSIETQLLVSDLNDHDLMTGNADQLIQLQKQWYNLGISCIELMHNLPKLKLNDAHVPVSRSTPSLNSAIAHDIGNTLVQIVADIRNKLVSYELPEIPSFLSELVTY